MRTIVETFVIEETAELIYDNEQLDRWNALVSQLGLEGQTKITSPEKSPVPFMHMKQSLCNVFETLCPRKADVTAYDITPIPVEILDLVALSKRENYFNKVEIWYDEKSPDPVCIGIRGHWRESSWGSKANKELNGIKFNTEQEIKDAGGIDYYFSVDNKYLIGKWGDVKMSFDQLKKMATKRYTESETNRINHRMKELKRELDDVNEQAYNRFN